jgi:hypothetical protein
MTVVTTPRRGDSVVPTVWGLVVCGPAIEQADCSSAKIQGRPKQPRPMTTPSHPVRCCMATASAASQMSPLPSTGMDVTAAFRSPMASQSAGPAYRCSAVRAWSETAAAPSLSAIRAASIAVGVDSSRPMRILTVTGTVFAARMADRTTRR